jgi:hypothetical protein
MGLLDWDYDELARRVQHGLDRLSVSFLRGHGARVHRDALDFHGYEHVELELEHAGHRLEIRQYGPAPGEVSGMGVVTDLGAAPAEAEFSSVFDGRPSDEVAPATLVRWLASLPAGEAAPEWQPRTAADDNPFAPTRRAPEAAAPDNPFHAARAAPSGANPFAEPGADERRQRALEWLQDADDA